MNGNNKKKSEMKKSQKFGWRNTICLHLSFFLPKRLVHYCGLRLLMYANHAKREWKNDNPDRITLTTALNRFQGFDVPQHKRIIENPAAYKGLALNKGQIPNIKTGADLSPAQQDRTREILRRMGFEKRELS